MSSFSVLLNGHPIAPSDQPANRGPGLETGLLAMAQCNFEVP